MEYLFHWKSNINLFDIHEESILNLNQMHRIENLEIIFSSQKLSSLLFLIQGFIMMNK